MSASAATTVTLTRAYAPARGTRLFVAPGPAHATKARSSGARERCTKREIDRLLDQLRAVVATRERLARRGTTTATLAELSNIDERLRSRLALLVLRCYGGESDLPRESGRPASWSR